MLSPLVLPIFFQLASPTASPPAEAAPASAPAASAASAPSPPRVLRLSEAVETALRSQPTVQQARAQSAAAEGRATQARQLYYPQVTAVASYQRVRSAAIGGRGAATTVPTAVAPSTDSSGVDIFTFGGSATQLLWDFGTTYNRSRAANRLVDSFAANEKVTSQNVAQDVRKSYFTAHAQKALIGVARGSLDNFQKHLGQTEGFVKVGTHPEIDLAQARTDVANARLTLINAENAYAVAKARLGRSIGLSASSDFDVTDDELPAVDGEELATERLVARAIAARPEIAVYEKQREANELAAKSYRGAYGPTLTASAGASETGTELGGLGPAWNVGLTASWPLFQGWLTHGQVREAEANADGSRAQMEGAKLQIRVDVEQAQLGIRAAKSSEVAAAEALTNARERLRLAEGRYTSGVGSAIELGDAQVALTTAEAQIVQAQFNLASARADLLAALGQR
jgi:outer membrane protein